MTFQDFINTANPKIALTIFSSLDTSSKLSVRQTSRMTKSFFETYAIAECRKFETEFPSIYKRMFSWNKDPARLFILCQREFNRLCCDYRISKSDDRIRVNLKIKLKQNIALCEFARKFIHGGCKDPIENPATEAKMWTRYLNEYPTPFVYLPLIGKDDLPEHLPPEISNFTTLDELHIQYPLKSLPPEIGTLKNLRVLSLIDTDIVTLPLEILNLNLKILRIRNLHLRSNSLKILKEMKIRNPQMQIIDEHSQGFWQKAANISWESLCSGLSVW